MKLNHATALDALCHGIEIYLSRDSQNDFMLNMLCETAFKLFADIKAPLLAHEMSDEDYKKQALHSTLQGLVIVNGLTGVPHGMGYPLSHFYEVPHGLACAVFEGEYLRILSDQKRVASVLNMLGFADIDEFCEYLRTIIALHVNLKLTREEINQWTQLFCDTQWRVDRHPEELTKEMVHGIYSRALKNFIID
jgi:alcohol dehydrogenase